MDLNAYHREEHDIPFTEKKAYDAQIENLEKNLRNVLDVLDDIYNFPTEGKYLDRAEAILKENGYI